MTKREELLAALADSVDQYTTERLRVAEYIIATVFTNLRKSQDIVRTCEALSNIDEQHWLDTGEMKNREVPHDQA